MQPVTKFSLKFVIISAISALFFFAGVIRGYNPPATIDWITCSSINPSSSARSSKSVNSVDLGLQLHSPELPLGKFKELFASQIKKLNLPSKKSNFLMKRKNQILNFDFKPKLPKSEDEWKKVQAYYQSAQCTLPKMPLLWDSPSDTRFTRTFTKRFLANKQPAKAQLWLLQGGPGGDGTVFDAVASLFYMKYLNDEVDIYIPDQRGVGRSDILSCSQGAIDSSNGDYSQIQTCINDFLSANKYANNGLFGFAPRQFVKDIVYISNSSKPILAPNQKVIVYGVSYGTYLVNEALKLYPQYFDGAVADSNVSLEQKWEYLDLQFEDTLQELVKTCETSAFCSGKFKDLGVSVRKAFETVIVRMSKNNKSSQCNGLIALPSLRSFFSLGIDSLNYRKLILPLVYRLYRCDEEKHGDMTFAENFNYLIGMTRSTDKNQLIESLTNFTTPNTRSYENNEINQMNGVVSEINDIFSIVAAGELVSPIINRTMEDYYQTYRSTPPYGHAPMESSLNTFNALVKFGGKYNNPYPIQYATSYNKPLMILHGTLDPRTPKKMGEDWIRAFTTSNPANTIVFMFNNSMHGQIFVTYESTVSESAASDFDYGKDVCGCKIFLNFVRNVVNSNNYAEVVSSTYSNATCYYKGTYFEAWDADWQKLSFLDANPIFKINLLFGLASNYDLWESAPNFNIFTILVIIVVALVALAIVCLPCLILCCPCILVVGFLAAIPIYDGVIVPLIALWYL